MVITMLNAISSAVGILAQEAQPMIDRLDPPRRAMVLAALAGLTILGFALVALAWLGARATRRYMNAGPHGRRSSKIDQDDWSKKALQSEVEGEDSRA